MPFGYIVVKCALKMSENGQDKGKEEIEKKMAQEDAEKKRIEEERYSKWCFYFLSYEVTLFDELPINKIKKIKKRDWKSYI